MALRVFSVFIRLIRFLVACEGQQVSGAAPNPAAVGGAGGGVKQLRFGCQHSTRVQYKQASTLLFSRNSFLFKI